MEFVLFIYKITLLLVGSVITWTMGLAPSLLLSHVINKPIKKRWAIILVVLQDLYLVFVFGVIGEILKIENQKYAALFLISLASYSILVNGYKIKDIWSFLLGLVDFFKTILIFWGKAVSVFLCFRYLQRRKMVLLSIAAVAMSCALLIATDSLFTGFINAIEQSVGQHLGDIILEAPTGLTITEYDTLIEDLQKAECIHSATAVLSSQGLLLSAPGKVRPVRVWGIELPRRLDVTPLKESLLFQKDLPDELVGFNVPDDPEAIGGIVAIGTLTSPDEQTDEYDIAGVREFLGHSMALTTGSLIQSDETGEDPEAPRFSRKFIKFKLADVMMTGVNEFDESFMLLPIEELSKKLYPDQDKSANIIHIRLTKDADMDQALAIVHGIWNNFAENRFAWYSLVDIDSAKQMQARLIIEYRKQMKVLLLIFGLVSCGIILLVFCIFYLIVMTRRRDIGILKSCGLSSPSVAGMFVLFGGVIGLLGGLCGIGLGWLIIDNINQIEHGIAFLFGIKIWKASTYMFTQIPNTMHWASAVWVTAAGIFAAALGSLIPAIAAARVKPVQTLQYE